MPGENPAFSLGRYRKRTMKRLTSWPIWLVPALFVLIGLAAPCMLAQSTDDFDSYKLRVNGYWFYSNPMGSFQDGANGDVVHLKGDLGFEAYSTFSGKVDWKFTRKNHIYFTGSALGQSKQVVLQRTIVFRGQTYDVGLLVDANLNSPTAAIGYQYDIIRRKRGHLGLGVQINLINAQASLSAVAQVTSDGVHHQAISESGSLLAPLPTAGPQFRYYLTNSPRVFVEGNLYGMYLFGYGNFVSTSDDLGFTINKHLSLNAGYQLGSRLTVNDDVRKNRMGIRLTQQGPIAGMEVSF